MPRTKRLRTTAVIVRNAEGKFLGVSRKDNYNLWGFAGGKCEKGESFKDCAKRELLEETGLVAEDMWSIDVRLYTNRYNKPITIDEVECFEVTKYSGELLTEQELIARGEGMLKWVGMEELVVGAFGDYNTEIFKEYYGLKSIYLVEESYDYEGSQVLAVFSKKEDAIKYVDAYVEQYNKRWSNGYTKVEEGNYYSGSGSVGVQDCLLDLEFYERP